MVSILSITAILNLCLLSLRAPSTKIVLHIDYFSQSIHRWNLCWNIRRGASNKVSWPKDNITNCERSNTSRSIDHTFRVQYTHAIYRTFVDRICQRNMDTMRTCIHGRNKPTTTQKIYWFFIFCLIYNGICSSIRAWCFVILEECFKWSSDLTCD